ncbi:MAG TPA: adenosyl-hopene transferase HpnH [Syntrophorhabdales bacterium]|nr:adenosyl-hopene transferase HpnH [Syntrophorhabdales bacterium]
MRFPAGLYKSLVSCTIKNSLRGIKRFPLVLMLEPTHRCNLACAGCDRIRLNAETHAPDLSLDECIDAAVRSGAPVVTVTGGEPLLYGQLRALIAELLRLKRYVYLCTNGLLAGSLLRQLTPHPGLSLNFHFDGMEETHDRVTGQKGTFRTAIEAIKRAKEEGFRVCTNTSVYKYTGMEELEQLFDLLTRIGVDGILISPAFSYQSVKEEIFLSREEATERFRAMEYMFPRYPFMGTPMYIDFLQGKKRLLCTPWGNPTRNPLGWKSPCYLVTDTYYESFAELMAKTDWDTYESGRDSRCRDCMVHSGYEASVMRQAFSNPYELLKLLLWNLGGT